jgi:hypothetical protein
MRNHIIINAKRSEAVYDIAMRVFANGEKIARQFKE